MSAPATTAQGDYTVTLTGSDGSGNTTTTSIDVEVDAGFVLDAPPQNLTIAPGESATSTIDALSAGDAIGSAITLQPAQVFDEYGNLVRDGSVSVTLGPGSVNVGDGSTSTATVSVGATVSTGSTYAITVPGKDAGVNDASATINVTVARPGLSLQASPGSISVAEDGATVAGTVIVQPTGKRSGLAEAEHHNGQQ